MILASSLQTENENGLLCSVPNPQNTHGTNLVCPAGRLEGTKRFEVEEGWINDCKKGGTWTDSLMQ